MDVQKDVESAYDELGNSKDRFKAVVAILNQRNNFMTFYSLVKTCIPDNVWLTNLEITNAPPKKLQSLKAKADGDDSGSEKKDESEDGESEEEQEEQQKSPEDMENSSTWINMTVHVISGKNTSANKSFDRDTALNNIISQMKNINRNLKSNDTEGKTPGAIFKTGDEEYLTLNSDDNALSISNFLLSVELTEKIDSPAMEEMLSLVFAAMDSEKKAPSSDGGAKEGAKK